MESINSPIAFLDVEMKEVNGMKDVRVLPINSVPVDADGDNDGVVDKFDQEKLNIKVFDLISDENKEYVFTVLKNFNIAELGIINSDIILFSSPLGLEVSNVSLNSNSTIKIESLCYYNDNYWAKAFVDTKYVYLKYTDITGVSNNIANIINDYDKVLTIKSSTTIRDNPWQDKMYETLADFKSIWYTSKFNNISSAYECPWFVHARVAEYHGIELSFNGYTDEYGRWCKGSGGWWLKTVDDIAEVVREENGEIIKTGETVEVKKVTTNLNNPNTIKANSIACFLYLVHGDYYGHVVYIEAVEKTITGVNVYYSDTFTGRIDNEQGGVTVLPFEDFIVKFTGEAYHDEPIFQGYIQF